MGRRYVPKTYYNRRFLRMAVRLVVSVTLAAVVLFLLLFFGLRQYEVYTPDGVRLEIPFLMDEPSAEEEGTGSYLLGFILGALAGALQLRLLSKFFRVSGSGVLSKKSLLLAAARFFVLPLIALLLVTRLLRGDLVFSIIGLAASLIVLTLIRLVRSAKTF